MQMSREPMRSIPVPMTYRMITEIEEIARELGVSRSQVIREFTEQGLKKQPSKKENSHDSISG